MSIKTTFNPLILLLVFLISCSIQDHIKGDNPPDIPANISGENWPKLVPTAKLLPTNKPFSKLTSANFLSLSSRINQLLTKAENIHVQKISTARIAKLRHRGASLRHIKI